MNKAFLCLWRNELRHLGISLRALERKNRLSKKPLTDKNGPRVSLTTYGERLATVHLTIESIARGSLLPSQIILWVDEPSSIGSLPVTIERLVARGLTVALTNNYGPHTKYYPSLGLPDALTQPLVIGDDDMIYPRHWLRDLARAYHRDPTVVHCYRAHSIALDTEGIAPYRNWSSCRSSAASFLHFATGVSGTILPPKLLVTLVEAGTEFMQLCPFADDVWLHAQAVRAGLRTAQMDSRQHNFPMIPGTQELTLSAQNVHNAQNDVQIARTYSLTDIAVMAKEKGISPSFVAAPVV